MSLPAVRLRKFMEKMMKIEVREIMDEQSAEALFRRIHGPGRLPEFLYRDARYQPVVLEFLKDGQAGGMLYGVLEYRKTTYYLHYLQMEESCRRGSCILSFLKELVRVLKDTYGADRMMVFDCCNTVEETASQKILKKVPGCKLEKAVYVRQLGFYTRDLAYLRKFRWYCPWFVRKQGCFLLPWKEVKECWKREILREEKEGNTDPDYLSPGIGENDWDYDEKTSFALMKEKDGKPIGWIITEALSGKTVRLRRFYIYRAARGLQLGPAFSTSVLDVIAEHYEELRYEVIPGNRQMEMFTDHYCKPILTFNYIKCNITINLI